jgi:hypothetical protein
MTIATLNGGNIIATIGAIGLGAGTNGANIGAIITGASTGTIGMMTTKIGFTAGGINAHWNN